MAQVRLRADEATAHWAATHNPTPAPHPERAAPACLLPCTTTLAGSGVLAVAALLMGAEGAVGTDVEPLAVKSTVANAALNGVGDRLASYLCAGEPAAPVKGAAAAGGSSQDEGGRVARRTRLPAELLHTARAPLRPLPPTLLPHAADLEREEPLAAAGVPPEGRLFSVTVANILQGPLVGLAPRLASYTRPGGLLGLSGGAAALLPLCASADPAVRSAALRCPGVTHMPRRLPSLPAGILQEQAPAVVEAYSPWFEGFQVAADDRWALVTATRRQPGAS